MQTLALWLLRQPSTAQRISASERVRVCPCCGCAHVGLCLSAMSFDFFFSFSVAITSTVAAEGRVMHTATI